MGNSQSQPEQSDSPDTREAKQKQAVREPDNFDSDQQVQGQLDAQHDVASNNNNNVRSPSRSPIDAHDTNQPPSLNAVFSSQVPASTQQLNSALQSHKGQRKKTKGRFEVPSSSPRLPPSTLARTEIAESPERFIPPIARPDSPELNVSPTRSREIAAGKLEDTTHDFELDSSSQPIPVAESPEERRQRKLAKKERKEHKRNQKLAQEASAMADSVFDSHGLEALSAVDHDPSSYDLGAVMPTEAPIETEMDAEPKPKKKKKSKKHQALESEPQDAHTSSDADLNQLVAFTNDSTFIDPTLNGQITQDGDIPVDTASTKKRRKSGTGDAPNKKQKNGHEEQLQQYEEDQYMSQEPEHNLVQDTTDQVMDDMVAAPKASRKKRKSKSKAAEEPLPEPETLPIDHNYANGMDQSGLTYGGYEDNTNDIPSHQPEAEPYDAGHMSLDEIARAISNGNIQSQYGAPNIPHNLIDPALAEHYAPEVPMHGLDVPLEGQDMHLQYGTYADPQLDIPPAAQEAPPATPPPAQTIKQSKSTARKRVAKPDFYSRVAEDFSELPSPSAAGLPPSTQDVGQAQPNGYVEDPLKFEDNATPDPSRPAMRLPKSGTVLTGPFADFELRAITQAIETWRVENNMTQYDINAFIHGNPKDVNSSEFWNRVISTCPNRRRQKVINQCRRKFHNFVARGTWTPEQHDELSRMWEMHGNKYTLIGSLINRHPEDVRDRIRNYVVCGDSRRKDAWSQEEEDRLANIVAEAIDAIRKMRERASDRGPTADEELVDWQMVSEKMERTRSRLQCITKWKLIKAQLEGGAMDGEVLTLQEIIDKARKEAEGMTDRDRYNVIKAIKSCGAQADSRIPWAKVRAEKVGDKWSRATLMLVWHRLKVTVQDYKLHSVPSISEWLCKQYHDDGKLPFLPPDQLNLEAEYEEIEHKVSKIIKAHNRPKSAAHISEKDELEDDPAALDVSHLPLHQDGLPVNGTSDDPDAAIQSQLEEEELPVDAVMADASIEPNGVLPDGHDMNGQNGLHESELPIENGHHDADMLDSHTLQQHEDEQLPQDLMEDSLPLEQAEEPFDADLPQHKTPKAKKTSSKKTPGTSKSESRRSSKKTYGGRKSKKGEAAVAVGDEDMNDASSHSSGSDNDIPAHI